MKRFKKLFYTIIFSLVVSLISPASISVLDYESNTTIEIQAKSKTVLVTPTGKKYHNKQCGNGTYSKNTLAKAKKAGLTPCKKCY